MITIPSPYGPLPFPIPSMQGVQAAVTNPVVQGVVMPVAYNGLALIFVLLGLYLMFEPEVKTYAVPMVKGAALAATAA